MKREYLLITLGMVCVLTLAGCKEKAIKQESIVISQEKQTEKTIELPVEKEEESITSVSVEPEETEQLDSAHEEHIRYSGFSGEWSSYDISEQLSSPKYARLSEEPLPEYVAGTSKGNIYPFIGTILVKEYAFSFDAENATDSLYGIVDEAGTIVCDDVFLDYYREGEYIYFTHKDGTVYKISYDGKEVEHLPYYLTKAGYMLGNSPSTLNVHYPRNNEIVVFEEDKYYRYISDHHYEINSQELYEETIDNEGNILSRRNIPIDPNLLCKERFSSYMWWEDGDFFAIEQIVNREYAILRYETDGKELRALVSLETGKTILSGESQIYGCDNNTFIVRNYAKGSDSYIADKDGKKISSCAHEEYIGNGLYFDDGKIVKYEDGSFTDYITDSQLLGYYGDYIFAKAEDGTHKLFDLFGNIIDTEKDAHLKAIYNGFVAYFARGGENGRVDIDEYPNGYAGEWRTGIDLMTFSEEDGTPVLAISENVMKYRNSLGDTIFNVEGDTLFYSFGDTLQYYNMLYNMADNELVFSYIPAFESINEPMK